MGRNRGAQERFRREHAKAKLRVENDRAQRRHAAAMAASAVRPPKPKPRRAATLPPVVPAPSFPRMLARLAVLGLATALPLFAYASGLVGAWALAVPIVVSALAPFVEVWISRVGAATRVRVADDDDPPPEEVRVAEEPAPPPDPACAECGEPVAEPDLAACASCIDPVHAGCSERHAARHAGAGGDRAYR